ncbi:unnamed protein product [Didymodactylos carnosus]|uniref:Retinol dehydrogenase 13 n=1 Tax=Didymodactylos carnosus TaxID=1234261 RepID=A0A813TAN8_9BILA|nr:unnamed protein product [Didymodactylos carnosus]CAF0806368.1 unnamed protein product [Didymodactylos carnosus]CAF3549786.1 unnamed protein product [Didymodactylos carnosus]CAF3591797.1 unnamed protein product [Didymodactylos carnosus]
MFLSALLIITVILILLYLLKIYYWSGGSFKSDQRLDGKYVIITGANTGIGKATATDLVQRGIICGYYKDRTDKKCFLIGLGAHVILACRDRQRAQTAADDIRNKTGSQNVEIEIVDTSSLESVKSFAIRIRKKLKHLDILINNAVAHMEIQFDDINLEKRYTPLIGYAHSKLANILFTRELAKRLQGTNITANSLHPGVIVTELLRYNEQRIPPFLYPLYSLLKPLAWFFTKNADQGSQTTIRLAVDKKLDGVTGKYFSDCVEVATSSQASDDQAAKRLWEVSEKMTRLKEAENELESKI